MRQSGSVAAVHQGLDPLWKIALAEGKRRVIADGEMLFERGEAARYVFFVVAGGVDVFRSDGRWRVVWSRTAGDMLSFDCDGRRELSCRARGPVELIAVSTHLLARVAQTMPEVAERMSAFNAEELKIMLSTLGDSGRMNSGNVIELEFRLRLAESLRGRDGTQRRKRPSASRPPIEELSVASP